MFKYFLNFLDLPNIGKIQISEPFGSDGQTHKITQEDGRYGRDVVIANEQIKLEFHKDHFEAMLHNQVLPNGIYFIHASNGFEILVSLNETKGWESKVEYIIEKDNSSFTIGNLDFFTAEFKDDVIIFNIIQNTKRELIKRRESLFVNAFSDKDLDGNTITPCSTSDILLKSKSIVTQSKWKTPNALNFAVLANHFHYFNPAQQIEKYEINNTLDWLDALTARPFDGGNDIDANNYGLVYALNDLSDITVKITNLNYLFDFPAGANQRRVTQEFILSWGYDARTPLGEHHFFTVVYNEFTPSGTNYVDVNDYSYTIPFVPAGAKIFLYFKIGVDIAFSDQDVSVASMNIDVTATETGIDSVIKGVRLIDLMRHNVRSTGGLPLVSSMYDAGGKHYNNFAFNGYLIAQFLDKPFNNTFADLMNIPKELNADYQINEDSVEILPYSDFYKDDLLDTFIEVEDEENVIEYNKRYFLKEFNYKYNKSSFENANNESNTLDDVHTEAQFMFPTTQADGVMNVELKHVRSAFLIEKQRKRFIFEKKTSENDDTLFLLDVIPVTEDITKQINRILKHFEGKIYSDGTFNWLLLGISVGDTISVNGVNVVVTIIEELIITTTGSFTAEESLLNITYTLTNVDFISRGNEGFLFIEGVLNPVNYSNLKYHIKRNMENFEAYFSTAAKYNPGQEIKETVFRVNDKLKTRLSNESVTIVDKDNIPVNSISDKKISNPKIHSLTVFCDFDRATALFKNIQTRKGFIAALTINNKLIKGHSKESEFEWFMNQLTLKLEERFEGDYLTIDKVSGIIFLKEVGYDVKFGLDHFVINNYFVSLYDVNNILLASVTDFRFIKINNVVYTDSVEFSNVLSTTILY